MGKRNGHEAVHKHGFAVNGGNTARASQAAVGPSHHARHVEGGNLAPSIPGSGSCVAQAE